MQHIIPTKVPYILDELYYTLWLVQTYYKAKCRPPQGELILPLTMAYVFFFILLLCPEDSSCSWC